MNILSEIFILAARDKEHSFEWVVPLIVVFIWIIGGIGKAIAASRDERQRREKLKSTVGEAKKMRYKPIPDTSSQQRGERSVPQEVSMERAREKVSYEYKEPKQKRPGTVASLKKAMQNAMEEAYAQQKKREAIKSRVRTPKKTQRHAVHKASKAAVKQDEVPVVEVQEVSQEGAVLRELQERENIRKAIIYSEILGKPLAMRGQAY